MPTIDAIENCFSLMYERFHDKRFSKALQLKDRTERELLPLIRVGLLCYFEKKVLPEAEVSTKWTTSGKGRVDFSVGTTAIEVAVRSRKRSTKSVSPKANESEVKKLQKWSAGRSVLVLFDFSDEPYSKTDLQPYRSHPSLGKGNHTRNAFTLLYYFVASKRPRQFGVHRLEVRRQSKNAA